MAKLRLLVWIVVLGAASVLLLRSASVPSSDDPAATTMAVVQVVAGVLAGYLCVASVLAIRMPRLAPSFVRRMVAAAVGGGMLLTPLSASAASAEPARPAAAEVPVLRRVPSSPATTATTTVPTPPAPAPVATSTGTEVVIAPGDHLWAVAERALADRLGRAPTDAEIVPFWTRLIEVNRDRLISGDPDLVLPGQRFVVPS
jgi:nucleoid-associated protein YgaU